MTTPYSHISEDDLHAYIDDELDQSRRQAVETYLATDMEAAGRVRAYKVQRDVLRAAFATDASGPLPAALSLSRIIEARLTRRRTSMRMIAAGVALFAIGGGAGWFARGVPLTGRNAQAMSALEQQAMSTHIVYAADRRHPIEVPAAERDHLAQWLSNRLDRHISLPDLTPIGYRLIGGRLLATELGGTAALFMYENDAHERLSVVLRPMAANLRSARMEASNGPVNLCAWIDNGLGYAVVAAMPDAELDRVSARIRQIPSPAG